MPLHAGDATLLSGSNYTLFKLCAIPASLRACRQQSRPRPQGPSFYASVVFLKIQDFARRPATEQARLRAQLQAVVAVTAAEIPPPGA